MDASTCVSFNLSGKPFVGRGLWLEATVHSSPRFIILSWLEERGTELWSDPLARPLRPGMLDSLFREPLPAVHLCANDQ